MSEYILVATYFALCAVAIPVVRGDLRQPASSRNGRLTSEAIIGAGLSFAVAPLWVPFHLFGLLSSIGVKPRSD